MSDGEPLKRVASARGLTAAVQGRNIIVSWVTTVKERYTTILEPRELPEEVRTRLLDADERTSALSILDGYYNIQDLLRDAEGGGLEPGYAEVSERELTGAEWEEDGEG